MAHHELKFICLRELTSISTVEDQFLIEGFLWERDHIILMAKEKVGKSILAMQMACALSSGKPFLGEYNVFEPVEVIYISTEGKQHQLVERFKSMTGAVEAGMDRLHVLSTHSIALDTNDGCQFLEELIDRQGIKPRAIFLDPLYMSMEGDLSDNRASRAMARNIRKLAEKYNAAIILVHHEHRSKRSEDGALIEEGDNAIMGSFVWKAFPDHVIHLRKMPDNTRLISCSTQRDTRVVQDMKLEMISVPLHYKILGNPDKPVSVDQIMDIIEKCGPISMKELEIASGLSIATVKRGLAYLQRPNVNKIKRENPGHRPTYYVSIEYVILEEKYKDIYDSLHPTTSTPQA